MKAKTAAERRQEIHDKVREKTEPAGFWQVPQLKAADAHKLTDEAFGAGYAIGKAEKHRFLER